MFQNKLLVDMSTTNMYGYIHTSHLGGTKKTIQPASAPGLTAKHGSLKQIGKQNDCNN